MKMQTDTLDIPLLLRLIEENPEWRALFRRALLSDDILELPELFRRLSAHVEAIAESQWQINEVLRELAEAQRQTDESVKALAEAQRRSEERLDRLEAAVQELAEAQRQTDESVRALMEAQRQTDESVKALAEAQRRSEERLDRLEAAVQELAEAQRRSEEAQRRTEQRVEELAEAQRRTEQRVEELAEAQQRTEQRVEELAEAQRRTEQRVEELAEAQWRTEQRVEELAEAQRRSEEAQRRTDERVDVLAQKVDHLSVEVNNLRRTIGATVEEEAEDWVMVLLEQKGYQILEEPRQVRMDGEVDVAIPAARDGQALWAVVEAKTRLSRREIEDWANRMRSEGFRQRLAQHGVPGPYLVYIYGLRVDAACDAAARRFGIGLVTGRGERVPPGPLLPPAQSEGEEN